jgi:hypothetical protein
MNKHRTDLLSLAFGLFFLAAVAWWAFSRALDVRLPEPGWLAAAGLIIVGLLGLLGTLRSKRDPDPAKEPAAPENLVGLDGPAATDPDGLDHPVRVREEPS